MSPIEFIWYRQKYEKVSAAIGHACRASEYTDRSRGGGGAGEQKVMVKDF